jgi:hypothetical protein
VITLRRYWVLAALCGAALRSAAAQAPAVVTQAPINPAADIAFHAMLVPREIYVGQQASYQVGVFIAEDARARLRRNPEFVPPELRAMLGYDLTSPSTFTRVAGGRRFEVHVFQRAIFPLVAGRHAIAPARLSYSLPLSTSFFSREESRTLRSESLAVIAREPPPLTTGQGSGYAGAVGMLTVQQRVDIDRASVGTPFVLTVAVRGVGNVALLPRPSLSLTWAQLVQGPERVQLDTTGPLVRGVKEFDYIVTPASAGPQTLPPVRYAYFDPYARRYASAAAPELAVAVTRGTLVPNTTVAAGETRPLSIRSIYRGALPPPLSSHASYWLVLAALPVPAAGIAFVRRKRRRAVRHRSYALRHLAAGTARNEAEVRRVLTTALGDRLQVDAATLADRRRIVRALRRRGVTRETALLAAQLHSELDAAVFGGGPGLADPTVAARAAAIFEAIDREATRRRASLGKLGVVSAIALAVSATVVAAGQERSADVLAFDRGVALYQAGAYASAQRVFTSIASADPRAADAWVNAGTSAWQAHDTAVAAVAWQRALRLEPLDGDTRDRLDLIPGFHNGFFGDVPPVPLSLVAWIGLVAWLTAWGLQPIDRRWASVVAGSAFVVATASFVGGLRLSDIAHGRQTAVVRTADRLRSSPSLGSDLAEEVMLGETVRTPTARTTWTFVRLRDGREGWLPSERLAPLELRD